MHKVPKSHRGLASFLKRTTAMIMVLIVVMLIHALPLPAAVHGPGTNRSETAMSGAPGVRAHKTRVVLDNFYNNEWRTDSSGTRVRFHYLWHDTANSGFSILGRIIRGLGASTDTLCRRPDAKALQKADIYIIVDPDTPQETDHPAIIDSAASDAVAQWVRRGGTLVLLGNDHGNADLAGLSVLGSRFGIRFNEDSRNRVVGKAYETGTFSVLPRDPLFKDVRKVYLKEISTLSLKPPAEPLLTDSGHVIMATARVGRGFVFAVGDPWFYDEYMDTRRLPADYDNPRTAENLFRWLIHLRHARRP